MSGPPAGTDVHVRTASDRAVLVEAPDLDTSMRLHRALEADPPTGVTELIPAARTILVHYDPRAVTRERLAGAILATEPDTGAAAASGAVTVPVHYDGEDLDDVAELLGVSVDEVVTRHTGATWQVAFCGFAPGFGYLACDDPLFDVPRRPSPRTRVPTGSVGLAGHFTGVYPRESPGGWQLIGHTDEVMWDLDREPPALFAPGATVRFEAARPATSVTSTGSAVEPARTSGEPVEAPGALQVVRPGLQLLVQDRGRPGMAALGVSASGAADRTALADANRAVGNGPDDAALEVVGGGAVLRFRDARVAAVTGATARLDLTAADGTAQPVDHGVPFAVEEGDELTLGAADTGLRAVVAVRGGVIVPDALHSRATDTLAGLGPAPLASGDVVALGDPADAPSPVDSAVPPRPALPRAGETVVLDIVLGPRDDWFTHDALQVLQDQPWLVTPRSDRVGVRLQGETPLARARDGELPSEGAVTGAIQVPPEGQPVLFLPDHPLTGGYPIIGAVVDGCLDLAAQLPPGAYVKFRVRKD